MDWSIALDAVVIVLQWTALAILVAGAFLTFLAAICAADSRPPQVKGPTRSG